jgi:5-methylcytosine-specific restriction endonuclease McrA
MGDYSEKLKDPRWQKKRLEIFERDGWKCTGCGSTKKTLHVHHLFYFKDREPWEINSGFLITLCDDCHNPKTNRNQDSPHDSAIEALGRVFDLLLRKKIAPDFIKEFLSSIDRLGKNG